MSNEWNQAPCKWVSGTPPDRCFTEPCATTDSVLGEQHARTPVWDMLFRKLAQEQGSTQHLTSIHNNAFLYNYSQPWITHFSLQHTHNQPQRLREMYGVNKPALWDEVKYEGRNAAIWGSLRAPQMVERFWWAAALGVYAGHGEVLSGSRGGCVNNSWSGSGGVLCGEAGVRIKWFRDYIENTTLHPPFNECVSGADSGFSQLLYKPREFYLFRFYNAGAFMNSSFRTIYLPANFSNQQSLIDPWRMEISKVWPQGDAAQPVAACKGGLLHRHSGVCADAHAGTIHSIATGGRMPEAAGSEERASEEPCAPCLHAPNDCPACPGFSAVGITVDADTLPHMLSFTRRE